MTAESGLPIKDSELMTHRDGEASRLMTTVEWASRMSDTDRKRAIQLGWLESILPTADKESQALIMQLGYTISNDPLLFTKEVNTVMEVVRDGIALSSYIQQTVGTMLGIEELDQLDKRDTITNEKQNERTAKLKTLATIRLFVLSHYIVWHLRDYCESERAGKTIPFPGLAELNTAGPLAATKCALYYYGGFIKSAGVVKTPIDLVQFTAQYFEAILTRLEESVLQSLEYTDPYTSKKFLLEGTDFSLAGFERDYVNGQSDTDVKAVEFEEILGNHVAKSVMRRIAQLLFLYDSTALRNPINELGGFPSTALMSGKPGTGKTMMIAAFITKILYYAKLNGIPVRILPIPRDLISKYQGISGERMARYMKSLQDPKGITIGFADDAEHYFQDRSSEGVSEGGKAVTNEFLVGTEGVNAIERGNSIFISATNNPELLDPAVLNRYQERFEVGGAETENDYVDFLYTQFRGSAKLFGDVINLKPPKDYEFLSDQKAGAKKSESADKKVLPPKTERMAKLYRKVSGEHSSTEYRFHGALLHAVQKEFPQFSFRDQRNIIKATKMELAGFDIPEAWTTDRSVYIELSFEEKVKLLTEAMRMYLKDHKVNFADILLKNTIRYLENYELIAGKKHEREISRIHSSLVAENEARTRFKKGVEP